jgi:CRISPR-associated endonuclease/helicase Cas3
MLQGANMSGMNKAERLTEMKRLYIQRSYSDIEMAERLGTRRETIFRDRKELETEYPFIQDSSGRWRIDRSRFISEIKVSLHEALTLYLAARKTSRQTRFHHPHAASAVEKLAATLRQPMTQRLLKTADSLLKQEKDPERIKILEILTQAWVEQYKVRIRYQGLKSVGITNHVISPYFIEPSIWSDSVYIVAYSDTFEKIIPFKIDRVESAVLSGEGFDIPEDFDEQELLKHAWGIWVGDQEPVTVKLRFSFTVTKRVKESIWHPLEKVEDTEEGGCIWSVEIAEWREMLPWVRGWGAEVEVLEPEGLRKELTREASRMAVLYQVGNTSSLPAYQLLWAKTNDEKTLTHPLICHMIDVAQVTLTLWKHVLAESIRKQLSTAVGLDDDDAARVVAFWIGLHDLGKASPVFQRQYAPAVAILSKAGLDFETQVGQISCRHDVITTQALAELLISETGLAGELSNNVAITVGGHHGTWPTSQDLDAYAAPSQIGSSNWDRVRQELVRRLKEILDVPSAVPTNRVGHRTF